MKDDAERTIPRFFDEAVEAAASSTWLRFEDEAWTYEQARTRMLRAAAGLREHGVGRATGCWRSPATRPTSSSPGSAPCIWAPWWCRRTLRLTEGELAGLRAQVDPRLVLDDAEGAVTPASLAAAPAPDADPGPGPAREDDPAVLMPTSGTTGRSKLVVQTHRSYVLAGEGFPWWLELAPDDRLMTSLPLFHINAVAYSTLGSVGARAGLVLLRRFSASGFLDQARRHGATEFNAIGAMLEILMRQPTRPDDADTPLRLAYVGPSPSQERQLEIEQRLGLRIVCGYGLSETPYGTVWERGTRPYGTLGSARQHPVLGEINEARVVAGGRVAGPGEQGELELRNPALMGGYWNMPEETAEVLAADGWFRTGDLVTANADGTYTFIGRIKEVIRRRGENVAPAEIEDAFAEHPAVVEAAAVAVPSELGEDDIKLFLVVAESAPGLGAIREWAAARLAPFKLPRYMQAVAELPRTPTGRIAKHGLPRERTPDEQDFETAREPEGAR